MVFKDSESLADLYSSITKKVEPTNDQLIRSAPLLNQIELTGEQIRLEEAYSKTKDKCTCKPSSDKNCACCAKMKSSKKEPVKEAKKPKPDYLDVDKDGDKEEPMKKALKDKKHVKETLYSFKELFNSVINEADKK